MKAMQVYTPATHYLFFIHIMKCHEERLEQKRQESISVGIRLS